MKTSKLVGLLLLLLAAFSFASCSDDDKVDIAQLVGKWSVVNDDPRLVVDGSVTYVFNADNTCSIHVYDALSGESYTTDYKYVISLDQTLITILDIETDRYKEQYSIRKLDSGEMKWESTSPTDMLHEKMRLVKY